MAVWLTSDLHLFHHNIIKFCKRPFQNIVEMGNEIIKRYNSVIQNGDLAFILGDFALGSRKWHQEVFNKLNGQKYLILGNHDGTRKKNLEIGFIDVYRQLALPNGILLIHDSKKANSDFNRVICGHVHQHWKYKRLGNRQFINVGVDVRDFKPVLLDTVLREFE